MVDHDILTAEEWDAAAHRLEAAAKKFLVRQMERGLKAGENHQFLAVHVPLTAIKEAGALAHALGCDPTYAERVFIAYLRGALRGADSPVHEDGRPFTGVHDA